MFRDNRGWHGKQSFRAAGQPLRTARRGFRQVLANPIDRKSHEVFYECNIDIDFDFESAEKIIVVYKFRIEMNQLFEYRQGRCVAEIYDFMTALIPASTREEPSDSIESRPMDRPIDSPQLQLEDPVADSI